MSRLTANPRPRRCIVGVTAVLLWSTATAAVAIDGSPAPGVAPRVAATAANAPPATRETLVDLLLQLEALQRELRVLRGQVEVQNHELKQMKRRERDLFSDFDRRLRELERRSDTAAAPYPPARPTTTVVPPGTVRPTPPASVGALPVAPAAPLSTAAQEQQDYDAAFNLLKQGYYERAAKSFREFIQKYPRGPLADNAQYWVGEANYVVRNFRVALEEFQKVLTAYPTSTKAPDSLLKIGYSHYELGAYDQARTTLSQVIARYANTTVAKSAEFRLEKMANEGH